jgi:hypothetical protein
MPAERFPLRSPRCAHPLRLVNAAEMAEGGREPLPGAHVLAALGDRALAKAQGRIEFSDQQMSGGCSGSATAGPLDAPAVVTSLYFIGQAADYPLPRPLLGKTTMRAFRGLFSAILFVTASLVLPVWATSFTTDQSDVWSVPGEDGWGFQIVQRGSVIFVTTYLYDPTNIPIWYTATLEYAGNFVWTGDLYLTSGSWFGTVPYNENALGYRKVGTMTWTATTITAGELRYDVDGVPIVKNATRLLLRYDDFSGHYTGGIHADITGCLNAGFNGTLDSSAILNITQNGLSISMATVSTTGGSCSFGGTLTQAGQMGSVIGSFACSTGETGSFQIHEMQVNPYGVTGQLIGSSDTLGCHRSGWFGGVRGTTF